MKISEEHNAVTDSMMTPKHPRWYEFCERLEGPEGCNFQDLEVEQERPEGYSRFNNFIWRCAGSRDKSYATAILKTMEGVDVPASLAYFDEHGGHCDCEILFNIA